MSTDLALRESTPATLAAQSLGEGVSRLRDWAASASAVNSLAHVLTSTSFVPQQFRGKPDEATAAILAGAEVGLSPMASLRSFDIIQGTAAPKALTLRAIVQSYGHEIVLVESTATRCKMKGKRRGSTEWQSVLWTIERATQLKLTGKDNWKNQPGAMLVARATSEVCRLVAADAILGIGYTAEEIADDGPDGTSAPNGTPEPEPTRRTVQRAPLEEPPADAPPLDEPEAPAPAEDTAADAITAQQMKKLHALLNEAGLADRDAGLRHIADVLGREVESTKALTKAEASTVIDSLTPAEPTLDEGSEWDA